jgi:hypothetical protein
MVMLAAAFKNEIPTIDEGLLCNLYTRMTARGADVELCLLVTETGGAC